MDDQFEINLFLYFFQMWKQQRSSIYDPCKLILLSDFRHVPLNRQDIYREKNVTTNDKRAFENFRKAKFDSAIAIIFQKSPRN